ncbi:hypothetical protein RhiirB3_446891 [Rhizophagus irregularis]|nr:hypothetical protein RhiirB3_446891 [Rhizophagus irregularis]
MLENIVSEWIRYDMLEFVEANKTLVQEQANTSIMQSHPQAYYTSRKITKFTEILAQEKSEFIIQEIVQEKSECFECMVED